MRSLALCVFVLFLLGSACTVADGDGDGAGDAGAAALAEAPRDRTTPPAAPDPATPDPATPAAGTTEPADRAPSDEPSTSRAEDPPPPPSYPQHGVSFHFLAHVYAEPSLDSPTVGHMRRGATFRATEPVEGTDCDGGWHGVPGGGFVCRGRGYLLGSEPRSFTPSPVAPGLEEPLPYAYRRVVRDDTPQYWRLPSPEEEARFDAWLASDEASADTDGGVATAEPGAPDVPDAGAVDGGGDGRPDFVRLVMRRGFYVSVDREEETEDGRRFVRTVRGTYVPAKALTPVAANPSPGVRLGGHRALPLALVYRRAPTRWRIAPESGALVRDGRFDHLEAFPVRRRTDLRGRAFVVASDGSLARDSVVRVARERDRPRGVPEDGRWIHVRLSEQTLVAYEGDRPVYATIVSTGRRGFETPEGLYWIGGKHVTTTMDDLASEDPFLIEDVPWAMFFEGSYALHGAFWHEGFGRVRSHGCINLAPADAQWLFRWTTPRLPPAWHGVMTRAGRERTHILVEP
ncbi:MAG: L,D-transpeptidase [Myxococcota bacterium]